MSYELRTYRASGSGQVVHDFQDRIELITDARFMAGQAVRREEVLYCEITNAATGEVERVDKS